MDGDRAEGLRQILSAEAEAEQDYEMLAAFGPGVEIVDVITGERWITGKGRIN